MGSNAGQMIAFEGVISDYVRNFLRATLAEEQDYQKTLQQMEEAGQRIVSGGQTGVSSWDIRDGRTNVLIEAGDGGYDGYLEALCRLDVDDRWVHIDHVERDDPASLVDAGGIPESLARALADWVEDDASDEDLVVVTGWDVEEVRRHRSAA